MAESVNSSIGALSEHALPRQTIGNVVRCRPTGATFQASIREMTRDGEICGPTSQHFKPGLYLRHRARTMYL
jgi:hypothetical protein